jgi:Aminopeptidase P, N-terminal domain.
MTDLNINIFEAPRAKVASNMEENSILLLISSHIVCRNNDTTFPFRQDSNFYYLTGLEKPISVLMHKSDGSCTIFCRQKIQIYKNGKGLCADSKNPLHIFKFSQGYVLFRHLSLCAVHDKGAPQPHFLI